MKDEEVFVRPRVGIEGEVGTGRSDRERVAKARSHCRAEVLERAARIARDVSPVGERGDAEAPPHALADLEGEDIADLATERVALLVARPGSSCVKLRTLDSPPPKRRS